MSYELNYMDDKNIVTITIEGRLNFGIVQQYSKEALKLAHENNCAKYLFDHTATLSETAEFKLHTDGDTLEKFGFKSNDKIAVVKTDEPSEEQSSQSAATNVKWGTTKYFKSIEKGMNWLEKEPDQ